MIEEAMIFAAGLGKRMLPLTKKIPKPLIKIGKNSMLKNNIEKLLDAKFKNIIVNAFFHSQLIINEVKSFSPKVKVIVEEERLETGGGVLNAIKKNSFNTKEPIILLNGDVFWIDQNYKSLDRIRELWDPSKMDQLICLKQKGEYFGYHGEGDFEMLDLKKQSTKLTFKKNSSYVFTGLQIINSSILKKNKKTIFSIKEKLIESSEKGRLFGFLDTNPWFHIGTVEDLEKFKKRFR